MTFHRDNQNVTHIKTDTIAYDGDAECEICSRPLSYPTERDPMPKFCDSCIFIPEMASRTYRVAGDGWTDE